MLTAFWELNYVSGRWNLGLRSVRPISRVLEEKGLPNQAPRLRYRRDWSKKYSPYNVAHVIVCASVKMKKGP